MTSRRQRGQIGFRHGGDDLFEFGVEIVEERLAFFNIAVGFRGEHLLVEAEFRRYGVPRAYPVQRPFTLRHVGAGAAAGGRVVSAVQLNYELRNEVCGPFLNRYLPSAGRIFRPFFGVLPC